MNKTLSLKGLGILIVFLLISSLVLSGCSNIRQGENTAAKSETSEEKIISRENPDENPETSPNPVPEPVEPLIKNPVRCPLDGQIVEKDSVERRPLAVMVENHPKARPQSGLNKADIVYEALVEGGISRFMPIYLHNDVDRIGPVRSSRHYYLDIVLEYNAIYAYFGGSPKAWEDIPKLGVEGLNGIYDGLTYWRDDARKIPHNVYTTTTKIRAGAERKGFAKQKPMRKFDFSDEPYKPGGAKADEVEIVYSPFNYTVKYIFDEEAGTYKRYMDGKPHTDAETGEQLQAKNIIIQYAKTNVIDSEGRLDIRLVGKGDGLYITNGYSEKITWEKKSRPSKTVFYDEEGKEIKLNPGQTWIQIVTLKTRVEIK
ncbi:MAG: hypothetical protein PWQ82_785 [Thermosediminibacterales bacterium]|nr:hypothetical protein [Thermosediminibacterales bacterium]MDK2835642.1 hypothetical protein [Thermosediminibacterales bacterium]